jgi:hypothetical protein
MSVDVPPPGGSGGVPPAPVAVQQTTVIQMGTHKNVAGAVVLAFLFGPLGMLYATIAGGIVMFFVNIVVAFLTLGLGLFFTIPLGMVWAGMAASSHNKQLQSITTMHVTGGQAPVPTAMAAGGQLPSAADLPPAATGVGEEDVTVILKQADSGKASCTSCGHEIDPRARFCSACGQSQAERLRHRVGTDRPRLQR